jgi:hypothetical protein
MNYRFFYFLYVQNKSKIGFDKRTVSDSNNYQKMANYCRKMELKYDLKKVLNGVVAIA